MIAIGIDPSSRKTGIAVISRVGETGKPELLRSETYVVGKASLGSELLQLQRHITRACLDGQVQRAVIERISVSMNLDTVRKIAYYEGACLVGCADAGVRVDHMNVSTARKRAMGKAVPKREAAAWAREFFGEGLSADEADAVILALATL